MDIQSMVEGGAWLCHGGAGTTHYVANPDHVRRLLAEGYQIVADPRIPVSVEEPIEEEEEPKPRRHKK